MIKTIETELNHEKLINELKKVSFPRGTSHRINRDRNGFNITIDGHEHDINDVVSQLKILSIIA
ncbi:hypothetical protein DFR65_104216 [Oceanihabitans sediminis]|uniref:Uncharacterized protein n=1 Tax=Oceanihabitans sediminis TaxID=1812012 RepID=A0A368P234_9FLAO|nr:hypothetical protein [Oceanihabitans sediminis]RBP30957.1 hypothetical protein DFR65_104216 [Oceanihabitans sediminis]RCU56912.1 hypothetical protein DU428_11250 [Oceanihabitans sediminis]